MGWAPAEPGTATSRPYARRSSETEGKTRANCGRNPTAAAGTAAATTTTATPSTTTVIPTGADGADPGGQSATADGRRATLGTSTEPAGRKLQCRWLNLDDRSSADGALDL